MSVNKPGSLQSVAPQLSVIVPVYKHQDLVTRCVDSILSQSFRDLELVLIDDGSPDGCDGLCDGYAEKDKRVRVVHKENGGVSSARNAGLDVALGEYVAFCDGDDWYLPEAFATMMRYADRSPDCTYFVGRMAKATDREVVPVAWWSEDEYCEGCFLDRIFTKSVCGALFKREIVSDNKIRFKAGLSFSEDDAFLCEYAIYSRSYYLIEAPVYVWYANPSSATRGDSYSERNKISQQFIAAKEINRIKRLAKLKDIDVHLVSLIDREEKQCLEWVREIIFHNNSRAILRTAYRELIKAYHPFHPYLFDFTYRYLKRRVRAMVK